jgi:hypothetical protein
MLWAPLIVHPLPKQASILPVEVRTSRAVNLHQCATVERPQHLAFALLFPTSTMALNLPLLKLYDCA